MERGTRLGLGRSPASKVLLKSREISTLITPVDDRPNQQTMCDSLAHSRERNLLPSVGLSCERALGFSIMSERPLETPRVSTLSTMC